ncbi:uncharacterized protein ACIBXB_017526 isoform 1-T1 [Morphnus guianensis]
MVTGAETIMALTERASMLTAATQNPIKGSMSREQGTRTSLAAHSSNTFMTEPNTETSLSLPATSLATRSTTRMADGEGRTDTAPATPPWEGSSISVFAGSEATRSLSLPATSLATRSTTRMADGEGRMDTAPATPPWEGSSIGAFAGSEATRSLSLPATSLATHSTTRMADREGRTDTAPATPPWEGSSIGAFAGTEATRPAFPTTSLDATATGVGTASVSADSLSLRPSSAATSHSSSSSAGSSAADPSPQPSSTSGTTEAGLAATSHSSTTPASSTPSSAPGVPSVGSGAVTAEAVTHSPAPSAPSPNPTASASSTSPASSTTEASLSSALAGSVETQAAWLTSRPRTQGQLTVVGTTSNSAGSPSPAAGTASVASRATTPPGKGESPTTNRGSGTTAEPNAKTSLSHPATLLVTQSMTNFRKSTSVNSSFTGTCLPVSIKVQNVTREAIQFSWTGGRRGSLYTVSLMDGNREINKTTTKETKTVFKHLLPSHIYTISVAVLPCAENGRTSASVRTDPVSCFSRTEFCLPQNTGCPDLKYIVCSYHQAFACSVLLKSQTFNHMLYNSDSEGYKTMSESIKTEVVREMRIKLQDDDFDIIMLGFRPGSVIAYFTSLLQKQEPIDVDVMQAYLSQILKSKFGDQTEVTVQTLPAQSSTGKNSTWRVAVIVLGVLLGVALVLILLVILVYIYMKKRSAKFLVEPKGLLGNFVYKHL